MLYRKIALFLLILFSISFQQFAQSPLKKGVYTLGGAIEGKYEKGEWSGNSDETYIINANPSFGYFVVNNLLVSGLINYSYYEDKYTNSSGRTSSFIMRSIGIGAAGRYYFRSTGIIPFAGVGIGYSKYLGEDPYSIRYNIEGGINYFLSNSVALEPYINYAISKNYKPEEETKVLMLGMRVNYYIFK